MSSGGSFNLGHFVDPLGLTVGKGKGGGAKNFWDPASIFTGGTPSTAGNAINSAAVPVPAAPITAAAPEVLAAEHDIAQQNLMKKSVKKTIYAGDTGGFNPMGSNPANAGAAAMKSYAKPRV